MKTRSGQKTTSKNPATAKKRAPDNDSSKKGKACSRCSSVQESASSKRQKDERSDIYICSDCIIDTTPRPCSDCGAKKPKDQFSARQWELPSSLGLADKTAVEIQQILMDSKVVTQTCVDCEVKKDRDEAMRRADSMKRHDIQFYDIDYPVPAITYSATKLSNEELAGTYDVLYHKGVFYCEVEKRTTKGTAVLKVTESSTETEEGATVTTSLTGLVEFHPDCAGSSNVTDWFQHDFDVSDMLESDDDNYNSTGHKMVEWHDIPPITLWRYSTKARVTDYDGDPGYATLQRIEKRSACPWTNYERSEEADAEEEGDEKVQVDTLEHAETLMKNYEIDLAKDGGSSWLCHHLAVPSGVSKQVSQFISHKPKPVFFLEPGDLQMYVSWSKGDRGGDGCTSTYILRKRLD